MGDEGKALEENVSPILRVGCGSIEKLYGAYLKKLRTEMKLADMNLVSNNCTFKAHKLILASGSSYLKKLLENINPDQFPVIMLEDMPYEHVEWILDVIYTGEAKVPNGMLAEFLKTAEKMELKDFSVGENKMSNLKLLEESYKLFNLQHSLEESYKVLS